MPKLSIITINYNNRDGLERTIRSVVGQTFKDFEYIVIDGGSTDGSVDVIKKYSDRIDYWVSEPDKGIYNAMNKGVSKATGDFCQFLNSGDWLETNVVIEDILPYLTNQVDILSGYTHHVFPDGSFVCRKASSPRYITAMNLINNSIAHPSAFIRRSCLLKRPYNERMKIVADWEFFVNAYFEDNLKYRHIEYNVALFDSTGVSSINANYARKEGEELRKTLANEKIMTELAAVPPEIVWMYRILRESVRFKRFLVLLSTVMTKLYLLFTCCKKMPLLKNGTIYPPHRNRLKHKVISFRSLR